MSQALFRGNDGPGSVKMVGAVALQGKSKLFTGLFVIALLSLSGVMRLVALPYKGEYILLSDVSWGIIGILAFFSGAIRRHPIVALPPGLRWPLFWLSLLIVAGTAVTFLYRIPGRSLFSLRLWGPSLFFAGRFFLTLGAMAVAYYWFGDPRNADRGARVLLLAGAFVALIVLGQFLGLVPDFWEKKPSKPDWMHVGPLSPHEGHLAGYALVMIALSLQVRLGHRRIVSSVIPDMVLILSIVAMIISSRRSGWVAMVVFFILFALMIPSRSFRRRSARWRLFAIISTVAFIRLILTLPELHAAIAQVFDVDRLSVVKGGNLEFRFVAPLAYMRYQFQSDLLFNLLLGTGFASTLTYVVLLGGTHNQLVTWLFELGLPGLLVYLWLVVTMFRLAIVWWQKVGEPGWVLVSSLFALNLYSMAGAIFFYGTLLGNFTVLFLVYFALALRLLQHEAAFLVEQLQNQTKNVPGQVAQWRGHYLSSTNLRRRWEEGAR